MPATVQVELWILADANGDTATGETREDAREHYEDNIGPLNEVDGFRLVRCSVKVPLPEVAVVELEADAPALPAPTGTAE